MFGSQLGESTAAPAHSYQRIGSISLVGLTLRPCASFTMLSRLTFRSGYAGVGPLREKPADILQNSRRVSDYEVRVRAFEIIRRIGVSRCAANFPQ